jgi:hypothetical protein
MTTPLALAFIKSFSTILSKSSVLELRKIFSVTAIHIPADVANSMKEAIPYNI